MDKYNRYFLYGEVKSKASVYPLEICRRLEKLFSGQVLSQIGIGLVDTEAFNYPNPNPYLSVHNSRRKHTSIYLTTQTQAETHVQVHSTHPYLTKYSTPYNTILPILTTKHTSEKNQLIITWRQYTGNPFSHRLLPMPCISTNSMMNGSTPMLRMWSDVRWRSC